MTSMSFVRHSLRMQGVEPLSYDRPDSVRKISARGAVQPENPRPSSCNDMIGRVFVKNDRFQSFIALVILANAAIIGLETDVPTGAPTWKIFEQTFLAIFTVELFLRLCFFGCSFFTKDGDWAANWFDFLLVTAGIVDFIMTVCIGGSLGHFTTFVRLCRLLRILRLFRLFKMFKALYMLASGFADSSVAVFWVSVLCSLCLYVCAVFLTRTLGQPTDEGEHASSDQIFYKENFGSVPRAMFTLFELMANPGHMRHMKEAMFANPGMMCFFIVFIVFGSFAMLSILTGVISEGMIQKGNDHKEELRFEEERAKQKFLGELREYFIKADANHDGTMTRDEFADHLPEMVVMFEDNGFSYTEDDLKIVFDLVDFDRGGTIDLEEFLQGMTSFSGSVTDTPLQLLTLQSNVYGRVSKLESSLDKRLETFNQKFMSVESRMQRIDQQLGIVLAKCGSPQPQLQ